MYENYSLNEKDNSESSEEEPKTERKIEPNKKAQSLIKTKSNKKGILFALKWILELNETWVCWFRYFIDSIKEVKSFKPKKLHYQEPKENKLIEEKNELKKQETTCDSSIIELDEGESLSVKEKENRTEPEQKDDLGSLLKGIENIKLEKKDDKKEKLKDRENKPLKQKVNEAKKDEVEEENKNSNQEEYIPLSMRMKKMYKGASIFN